MNSLADGEYQYMELAGKAEVQYEGVAGCMYISIWFLVNWAVCGTICMFDYMFNNVHDVKTYAKCITISIYI